MDCPTPRARLVRDSVMSPLQGRWMGWIPIHVGPRPYAMLCCPYRASITLRSSSARLLPKGRKKGCYNTARGLAPGYRGTR